MKKKNINSSIDTPEEKALYGEEVVIRLEDNNFSPINDEDDDDEDFSPINDDDDDKDDENSEARKKAENIFREFEKFMDSMMSRHAINRNNSSNGGNDNGGMEDGGNGNNILSRFTTDLTEKAGRFEFDPVTGRERFFASQRFSVGERRTIPFLLESQELEKVPLLKVLPR